MLTITQRGKYKPNKSIFQNLWPLLERVEISNTCGKRSITKWYNIRDYQAINYFNENLTSSTRLSSRSLDNHRIAFNKVLKYHSLKPIIAQGIVEDDFVKRLIFCNWYINK